MVRNNHSIGGIIFEDLETGEVISDVILYDRLFEEMRFDSGTGTNLTEVAVLESVVAMSTPTSPPTTTTTPTSPLDGVDEFIQNTLDDYEVPGAVVVVVQDDKVVFLKGYVVREWGNPAPVDENTRFQLASNTKLVTATGLVPEWLSVPTFRFTISPADIYQSLSIL